MSCLSNIREATPEDLPQIRVLLGCSTVDLTDPGHHHALVLDDDSGHICAIALVTIADNRGHLERLAIADQCAGEGIEDRMIAVVEALCTAFGASTIDVPYAA
jgi:N-acetylglutamate synthase-like GNAT family acetyltransferase